MFGRMPKECWQREHLGHELLSLLSFERVYLCASSSWISTCVCLRWIPWVSLFFSQLLDPVVSLSGVHLWCRVVRRDVRSMCLLRHYLVLRCHLGQVFSFVKPTLLPVPACGHSPHDYHLPRNVSSHFLYWRGSWRPRLLWPRSQFHAYRDSAGCWFLLFHRPTLCVVLAVFLSMFLRVLSHSLPCSPSHVLRGQCGAWERVLVIVKHYLNSYVCCPGVASASLRHRPTRARGSFGVLLGVASCMVRSFSVCADTLVLHIVGARQSLHSHTRLHRIGGGFRAVEPSHSVSLVSHRVKWTHERESSGCDLVLGVITAHWSLLLREKDVADPSLSHVVAKKET